MAIIITRVKKESSPPNHLTKGGKMCTHQSTKLRLASAYLFATLRMMKKYLYCLHHSTLSFSVAFLSLQLASHTQVSVML